MPSYEQMQLLDDIRLRHRWDNDEIYSYQSGFGYAIEHLLSRMERRIVDLRTSGHSIRETAKLLKMAPKTVENHVRTLLQKFEYGAPLDPCRTYRFRRGEKDERSRKRR